MKPALLSSQSISTLRTTTTSIAMKMVIFLVVTAVTATSHPFDSFASRGNVLTVTLAHPQSGYAKHNNNYAPLCIYVSGLKILAVHLYLPMQLDSD